MSVFPQKVQGVVSRAPGQPVELVDVVIPEPGAHDVVVTVISCGVCHTDLAYKEGNINDEFPFLLGHEVAGVVEEIGSDVHHVQKGDYVVLNWRAVCGECRACKRGEPWYCFDSLNAEKKMTLTDGTELTPALGIGGFIDKTLVHEKQCVKISRQTNPAVAGLMGCGVMSGIGAAINTAPVRRGDSVAVIGCGGVGSAAVVGARLAGASTIIAIDTDDRKLESVQQFGATHVINSKDLTDEELIDKTREIVEFGTNVVIDAVGIPKTYKQAFYIRDLAGVVVLVGVPAPTMKIEFPLIDFFSHGGALKSSWYGDALPERDFPMLLDLYNQGRLPLDKFVTGLMPIKDIAHAFEAIEQGTALRSVIMMREDHQQLIHGH